MAKCCANWLLLKSVKPFWGQRWLLSYECHHFSNSVSKIVYYVLFIFITRVYSGQICILIVYPSISVWISLAIQTQKVEDRGLRYFFIPEIPSRALLKMSPSRHERNTLLFQMFIENKGEKTFKKQLVWFQFMMFIISAVSVFFVVYFSELNGYYFYHCIFSRDL